MIYLKLFLVFLQIGAFTFGGGYAMLPMMKQQVLEHGWMDEEQLLNFIAVAESTPGPIAINMATYIGMETADIGVLGAICATLGVVLPSFVVIMIVARFYEKYKNSFVVKNCLTGIRPAVIGLMASAVITLAYKAFLPSGISVGVFDYTFFCALAIFGVVVVLAFKKVNPIYLILLSALLGIGSGYAEKLF